MQKKLMVVAACAMVLGGSFVGHATTGPGGPHRPGRDALSCQEPFPAGLARILELSEAQKEQVRAILEKERGKGAAQQEKESALRKQLDLAERAAAFDEQAVIRAASALAGLEVERTVSRARIQHRITAILTPAQRSLAERLRPEPGEMPPPPCGCGNEARRRQVPADDRERR
jgi:periplasmic protein CpxP/Spy